LSGAGGFLYSAYRFMAPGEVSRGRYLPGSGNDDDSGAPAAIAVDQTSAEMSAGSFPPGGSRMVAIGHTPVIIVQNGDSFTAFNATCTHLGCLVKWETASSEFVCPCHLGRYDANGRPTSGPPPLPLRKCAVSVTGDTLTVSIG